MKAVLAATLLFAASAEAQPSAPVMSSLGWLQGKWVSEEGERWTEEVWTDGRGGMMLGLNRSGKGDSGTGFEYMRIAAAQDGTLYFWGSPGGKPAVPFRLTEARANEAVFENPQHDFPTRIVYRRDGSTLIAQVSGPAGKNAMRWTFRRVAGE